VRARRASNLDERYAGWALRLSHVGDEMHVLSGWEESGGVKAEIEEALKIGIIVKYM